MSYRTISIGSILVQGLFERAGTDGRMVVRVGNQVVQGWPVDAAPRHVVSQRHAVAPRAELAEIT